MGYRHTQFGYVAPIVLVVFAVLMVVLGTVADDSAGFLAGIGAFFLVLGAVVVNFNRLTAIVEPDSVVAVFGWGWPRRRVFDADIVAVRRVRNRWWYGWGIRWIPNGWMYNVWGLDAVELELASGRVFRIGTDEPDELAESIAALIGTPVD